MKFRQSVCSAFAILFVLPLICSAQLRQGENRVSPEARNASVSVHELLIPGKARKAFNKGTQLLAAKEFAAGIAEFQRAIKVFPDFYEAYYEIGLAQLRLNREEEAQSAFDSSIALSKSRYALPHFGLGIILANQKQFARAEATIRAGLELDSGLASGHFILAWVLAMAGQPTEAEKSARQAISCDSKLALAYLLLAEIHQKLNNPAAVVNDTDSFLKLAAPNTPASAAAETARAHALLLLSQKAEATAIAKTIP
jgi:tetratricopeptide (TPR) repeat protein